MAFNALPDWVSNQLLECTDGVLHLLAFDRSHFRRYKHFATHVWSGPLPEGSFHKPADGLYVESPAFMFLHAATILDLPQLVSFGDELCGLYSFDSRAKRGFTSRSIPLTDKRQLENYLKKATGCRGFKQATQALRHVVERSASPMETFDEITMCFPALRGGYALPQPRMNHWIPLTPKAARIAKRSGCYLDMGYPHCKLDIEHHGKLDHSSDEDVASDRARVNGLKEIGFEVIELTADQVGDLFAYEFIIERIARILGKRLQKKSMGATPARTALRKALYEWNSSSGRIR